MSLPPDPKPPPHGSTRRSDSSKSSIFLNGVTAQALVPRFTTRTRRKDLVICLCSMSRVKRTWRPWTAATANAPRLYENSNVQHFAVKADIRKRKLSGKIRQLLKADSEATYALLIRAVLPQLSMPFT
jgi:hypothetical protein